MNPSPSDSPRFACRLARGLLATLDRTDAATPRGPGSGHIAGCADCQRFFAACDDLDLALTRDATRLDQSAPAGLERRIALAVARSTAPRPEPARPALPMFALLGAAACAAVAIFVFQTGEKPAETTPPPAANIVAVIDSTRTALATHSLRSKISDTIDTAANGVLREDPLTIEARALEADARSALRFLALNFLPHAPEALVSPPPRRRSNSG